MPSSDFYTATKELFEQEIIEVLEWSFDMGWGPEPLPDWVQARLMEFSSSNRLLGHGVGFSALTAKDSDIQDDWLRQFRHECEVRNYLHISEHYGFSRATGFDDTSPLPVPRCKTAKALASDKLRVLAKLSSCPIGLENLAFAFSAEEAKDQAGFIRELLELTNGFLLLDLHNLYCQMENFDLDAIEILSWYPLSRVKEIHISGGSWSSYDNSKLIRRDTHDNEIPQSLFELLPLALKFCPALEFVIFERLANTIQSESDAQQLRNDYRETKNMVESFCSGTSLVKSASPQYVSSVQTKNTPKNCTSSRDYSESTLANSELIDAKLEYIDELEILDYYEEKLLDLLFGNLEEKEIKNTLIEDPKLISFRTLIETFEPRMIHLAKTLTKKWAVKSGS